MADSGILHKSIKCYLAGIRHLQITSGLPDPCLSSMAQLEQVLRDIKSEQAKTRQVGQSKVRLPITASLLRRIRSIWAREPHKFDHITLWAACTLCFFVFFRAGEITSPSDSAFDPQVHLSFSDLAFDRNSSPSMLRVHLKSSKTDPFRKEVDVFIGGTTNDLCPITAIRTYLAARGSSGGALFRFQDGRLLTRDRFVKEVRDALKLAELNPVQYAGHSFRSGAATRAAQCGIPESTTKMLGRWESCTYLIYIRTPRDQLASFTSWLSNADS